jgi:hypothetical protein
MLRLPLGTIAVSRGLWLEAGMANSSSNDLRQAPAIVRRRPSSTMIPPSNLILDHFVDNNIQTLPASGRKEISASLFDQSLDPQIQSAPDLKGALAERPGCGS